MKQKSIKVELNHLSSNSIMINFPLQDHYEELFHNRILKSDMICIMTPSYGKFNNARLNYNHLMLNSEGTIQPFIHLVFVRKEEFQQYKLCWGNYVGIVEIPEEMLDIPDENVNNGGIGYARRFIQRFCHVYSIKNFYMADDSIVYIQMVEDCLLYTSPSPRD